MDACLEFLFFFLYSGPCCLKSWVRPWLKEVDNIMLLFFNCNLICTSVNIYRSSQEYILQLASKLHSESHSILLQSIQPHYLLISNDTENLITNDNRSFLGKLLSYLTEMAIKFCIMLMALWPLLLKLFLHPHSSAMHDFKSWLSSFFCTYQLLLNV